MEEAKSLRHINNTPWENTLNKITQFDRVEKAQRQKQDETRERKEAVNQLTDAFLNFSRKFLSISKEAIAKLEPEECQILCENLLLHARQKRRLPLRICGTVAVWGASLVAAIVLPFFLVEGKDSAFLFGPMLQVGGLIAFALTTGIWGDAALRFLDTYNKCLCFTDKPGTLLVEHARKSVKKEIPQ